MSGPSSSGKTTSSKKLSLYLKSLGLNPTHLSLDDYFYEREETPLASNGKPDFESLKAIDVKLFDNQIIKKTKIYSTQKHKNCTNYVYGRRIKTSD